MLAAVGYDGPVEINTFFAGMIALAVVFAAYCSEVLQSAFQAIPRGQYEAGEALGLRRGQTMRKIILPQLVRIALPGLGNLWMALLKDTALVSVIGLSDICARPALPRASPSRPSNSSALPAALPGAGADLLHHLRGHRASLQSIGGRR